MASRARLAKLVSAVLLAAAIQWLAVWLELQVSALLAPPTYLSLGALVGALLWIAVVPLVLAAASAAALALSESMVAPLAVLAELAPAAVGPVGVAVVSLSVALGGLSALASAYLLRRSGRRLSRPRLHAPSPLSLSVASLLLLLEARLRAPWLPQPYYAQAVYVACAALGLVVVSQGSAGRGSLVGAAASLGPLGLAAAAAYSSLMEP